MFDRLESILSKVDADYADVRYETKKVSRVIFNKDELSQVDSNSTDGYVLRILKNGGFSSISFTREEDAGQSIRKCLKNTRVLSRNKGRPVELADVEVVRDEFVPQLNEDPADISIDEKIELLRNYNDIPLSREEVISTNLSYSDTSREKYFASTEGARIKEDLITTRVRGLIVAGDGNKIQQVRVGGGGSNGFSTVRNLEGKFEKKTKIAVDLLSAEPVRAGKYNVILNSSLAGVFTHEAFGHFSEADLIEDNPTMREKMQIDKRLGSEVVNIVDDPTMSNQLGFYKYDDEGVRAEPVQLMRNGVLTGRLHSRRTAVEFGEKVNGHCVAEDYRYAPIIRMGTIFIQKGDKSFEELTGNLGDGLYLLDAMGGQTSGENFTFGAQYGYKVKGGKVDGMIRDINISGNLYRTLKNIEMVGDDLELSKLGGCGKEQLNIRSCHGSPHILVKNVVVGGK